MAEHRLYMQLVRILLWIMTLGRIDIVFAISFFSRFSTLPRKILLEKLDKILGLLEKYPDK